MTLALLVASTMALGTAAGGLRVEDFGAKADASVDASAAIQQALDQTAMQGGGRVDMGAGRFRLDRPLTVPTGVTLAGVWEAPHHAVLSTGTVFHVYAGKNDADGPPLIKLNESSCVRGITFFYPEQRIPGTQAYPWTIQGEGMHCSVMDCTFVNSYRAIDFGTHHNELHYIRNCFGCPLNVGIHIDRCSDIGRIENVHFNPHYWGRAKAEGVPAWDQLLKYLFENLVAFEFGYTDWQYVHNTFCYGAKVGYRFFMSNNRTVNGNFLGIGADWCHRAVLVEASQIPGLLITNGEFVGGTGSTTVVEVRPEHIGVVQMSNCSFWGPFDTVARVAGSGMFSMSQCTFHNHGSHPEQAYTIDAEGGHVSIQDCRFGNNRPDIRLGPGVRTARIIGNWFQTLKEIEILTEGEVQEGLNVVFQQQQPPARGKAPSSRPSGGRVLRRE